MIRADNEQVGLLAQAENRDGLMLTEEIIRWSVVSPGSHRHEVTVEI